MWMEMKNGILHLDFFQMSIFIILNNGFWSLPSPSIQHIFDLIWFCCCSCSFIIYLILLLFVGWCWCWCCCCYWWIFNLCLSSLLISYCLCHRQRVLFEDVLVVIVLFFLFFLRICKHIYKQFFSAQTDLIH